MTPLEQAQFTLATSEADRFLAGVDAGSPEFCSPVLAPKAALLETIEVIADELVRFRHEPEIGWKLILLEILKGKIEKRDA